MGKVSDTALTFKKSDLGALCIYCNYHGYHWVLRRDKLKTGDGFSKKELAFLASLGEYQDSGVSPERVRLMRHVGRGFWYLRW